MTTSTHPVPPADPADAGPPVRDVPADVVRKALATRSYAVLATVSPAGRPHAAGVLYTTVGDDLWVSTETASRKGRNLVASPHVAVTVPVRRLPLGPPATIHFQGRAEVLAVDDPEVRRLVGMGELKGITSHGELDLPGGCMIRITPAATVHTYGVGMSLWSFVRNPLAAAGRATFRP
ncbi:pyridoxamine 5'-phosphate oxidase family protein [Iamia sp. SCSIO 61187]|uniref:pyridoxamine 5'-phosphate oxidase family protein n=1 Tax=Iamia sp. SCSIO 61187 TaxID=2722752 RepID=UPI001C630D3A|nr:pyridoxamine 5'-phosphate oxidase family protein [Iamia sp. SCSIO 61187]QYG91043.1 pyridoxamine 5'-phosphate oxidase family protein [Iamia sp. SCSIO 61187]